MLIAFNKPFGVLSQFTDSAGRPTLADYIDIPGIYPCGRLDRDSEGLLLLTDDGKLQATISRPGSKWVKTYFAQVEGTPTAQAIMRLQSGVELNDGMTVPASVELQAKAPGWLWKRNPVIKPRKGKSTSWLKITLQEGRNRQVRRMTAAVNLPTLRLIRYAIGAINIKNLQLSDVVQVN